MRLQVDSGFQIGQCLRTVSQRQIDITHRQQCIVVTGVLLDRSPQERPRLVKVTQVMDRLRQTVQRFRILPLFQAATVMRYRRTKPVLLAKRVGELQTGVAPTWARRSASRNAFSAPGQSC